MTRHEDPTLDFLRSVRWSRVRARRTDLRLQELRAAATQITQRISGMPGGGSDPHRDGLQAALADLETRLSEEHREALERERAVSSFLSHLPDASHREVLTLRYVHCLRWPQIREELEKAGLYYEERQIYRIHGNALQAARRLWQDTEEEETYEDSDSQNKDQ